MRAWVLGGILLLLPACAVDRSALTPVGASPEATATYSTPGRAYTTPAGARPVRRVVRSAPAPRVPACAMSAQSLAHHMGLQYRDDRGHVLLTDRATNVRIWKDSNEVSVDGRVAKMPERTRRQGSTWIVPARTVSYVEGQVLVERKRLDSYTAYHAKPTTYGPVRLPAPLPQIQPIEIPRRKTAPAPRPAPKVAVGGDPAWAKHKMPSRKWKWIVLHHSADTKGDFELYDKIHRESNGWDECGYHFVIGNGSLSRDGEVEIGSRWRSQKHGAHARGRCGEQCYNQQGVGICMVGDFEAGGPPSRAQMDNLVRLVRWLMATHHISADMVIGHEHCKPTKCPGRYFPWAELRRRIR